MWSLSELMMLSTGFSLVLKLSQELYTATDYGSIVHGLSPSTWLKIMAEQAALTGIDHYIESEISCFTTATNDSADLEEVGNSDGSQSDEQCSNNAARKSTHRRKPPER